MFGWFDPKWKKAFDKIQFTEVFDAFEESTYRGIWDMYAGEGAQQLFDTYLDTDKKYLKFFKNPKSLDDFDVDIALEEMIGSYQRMIMLSFDGVRFDEKRLCKSIGMLILMIDCIMRSKYEINYSYLKRFKSIKRLKSCTVKELIKNLRKEVA